MNETEPSTKPGTSGTELARDLSCFDITMIGVGAMIGAGIFVLTGIAAGTAGPALILSFALNGIVTIFTAMVYAELGSAIPEAGGGYLWVKEGLPGANAFLAGWMSWFAHAVAGSLYALGFGAYFELVLQGFHVSLFGIEGEALHKLLGAFIAVVFLYINYRGASETGLVGNIVTLAKLVVLATFVASGFVQIASHPEYLAKFTPFAPEGFSGIFTAMGLTFIAFEGYEIIVQAGEEVKDPRRAIPRAVFWSIAIVVPVYILVAFVALGAVDPGSDTTTWQWLGRHAEIGLAEAARQFMPFGTVLLLLGGLLATMSALNATTFSSTRVSFAMGRDRNLPDRFASIHPRTRTPVVALLASAVIIIGVAVAIPIEHVAAATDIMFLLLFLQVNVAVITLRKKYGDKLSYGYVMPFFPIVPIIGIGTKLFLALFMFHYSPLAWYVTLGWIGAGVAVFRWYAGPREREKTVTPILAGELLPRRKERYRVLVPIARPQKLDGVLAVAARIAELNKGEIVVLHAIHLPYQAPLRGGHRLVEEARPAVDAAMRRLEDYGVPASSLVRLSHKGAWQAILDTVQEYGIDFAVMGWRGRPSDPRSQVGRNIDRMLLHANCNTVVIQDAFQHLVRRVLVPVAQPNQGELMTQVACLLTTGASAQIDLLHVVVPGTRWASQAEEILASLGAIAKETTEEAGYRGRVTLEHVEASDPVAEITRRASSYDAVVLGAPRESWLTRQVRGTVPQRIAAQVECPVVLISRQTAGVKFGVQSFVEFFRNLEEESTAEEDADDDDGKG